MTMIHFNYTDSYANPSRGSLAFMPHRRHAANETEILPKPFTVPLLNGEVTVDLQPNASTWVWIVTEYFEEHAESFYTTVPDQDGVLEHTELTKINPSSIPAPYNAVEPAWWAEIKATKDTVTETLLKSGEALEEAQKAIEDGEQYRDEARVSASDSKAYFHQSRDYAYDAKEHRDEAERQADRATDGPESAQAQAEQARDESVAARNDSQSARDTALEYRDQTRDARDTALEYRDTTEQHLNDTNTARDAAEQAQTDAEAARNGMITDATVNGDNLIFDTVGGGTINAGNVRGPKGDDGQDYTPGEWQELELLNGWEPDNESEPPLYRETQLGIQVVGAFNPTSADNRIMFKIPNHTHMSTMRIPVEASGGVDVIAVVSNGNTLFEDYENVNRVIINTTIPQP